MAALPWPTGMKLPKDISLGQQATGFVALLQNGSLAIQSTPMLSPEQAVSAVLVRYASVRNMPELAELIRFRMTN